MSAVHGDDPDAAILDAISDGLRASNAMHQPLFKLIELRDARIAELGPLAADQEVTIRALEAARTAWEQERSTLHDERSTLLAERSTLHDERSTLLAERSTLHDERSTLLAERSALHDERSTFLAERSTLHEERSTLLAERSTLHDERSTLLAERSTLHDERSTLLAERSTLHDERNALHEDRRTLLASCEMLRQALSQAEQARQAVINSTCWRLTAPLRSLGRLGRGASRPA